MYVRNAVLKTISVTISLLLIINNISFALPDFAPTPQKKSTLREISSGLDGATPEAIGADLDAIVAGRGCIGLLSRGIS